ncbi:hypothetical protein HanRHA438_Chr02g0062421 [Helianthus annuus]|nr:hypothetical protein HanRHA438_Chr02g0062421 [Helianthus annuus]
MLSAKSLKYSYPQQVDETIKLIVTAVEIKDPLKGTHQKSSRHLSAERKF